MRQSLILALLALLSGPAGAASYADHPQADAFVQELVAAGFEADEVRGWLRAAEKKQSILDAISRPAEAKPWFEYRPIFVNRERIELGAIYWDEHETILDRVEQELGVDPHVIVAIVGVETRYGRHAGRYRVLDALATLGFDYPPRADFFRRELHQFFLLSREEGIDMADALGSYAGAMGHGQFIPSSYRHYAVDFDQDGQRNLWHSPEDILGSVGNYLQVHGWEHSAPVAIPARVEGKAHEQLLEAGIKPSVRADELSRYGVSPQAAIAPDAEVGLIALETATGQEYWVIFNNFYVITRYNRSPLYAMAVHQLSRAIAERREQGRVQE
ncbi:lytic murein transglycosylase B [Thiohalobacter thiocyanaticus]|uniref:Lytic murein transglycosylase B n=1 Tax=Thiohalobacter thiocyanaticus TaxID=585455 RepID=A0A1Z4VUW5_9GAMM|nr:lytic murein transglycosylase B [Thiohalobacter thiocyanaticus]BAZ95212.1 lytic murein transglycosylase B [Thiohalobacter thiocyanaticus]